MARALHTTNTNKTDNRDNKFGTWFWNKSANKMDSDIKEKNNNYENNLEEDKSKTEKTVSSEIYKIEIK